MVAIGMGESGLNPGAHNPKYPDDSYGLFQINMLDEPGYQLGKERRARYGLKSNEQLKDPFLNAKAALDIRNRQGLGAWSVLPVAICWYFGPCVGTNRTGRPQQRAHTAPLQMDL